MSRLGRRIVLGWHRATFGAAPEDRHVLGIGLKAVVFEHMRSEDNHDMIIDRLLATAIFADQMMVNWRAGIFVFEPSLATIDLSEQPHLVQPLQIAVDRRDIQLGTSS